MTVPQMPRTFKDGPLGHSGMKAAGVTQRLSSSPSRCSGAMVPPVVVGPDEFIGHVLLLRRQAGVERLERREETPVIVGTQFGELPPRLEALDRIHRAAVLPGCHDRLVECLGVVAH